MFDSTAAGFVAGASFMTGLICGAYLVGIAPIKACEATLPRNQHCEITAVPKDLADEH